MTNKTYPKSRALKATNSDLKNNNTSTQYKNIEMAWEYLQQVLSRISNQELFGRSKRTADLFAQ